MADRGVSWSACFGGLYGLVSCFNYAGSLSVAILGALAVVTFRASGLEVLH